MQRRTLVIDLAKNVFEIGVVNREGRTIERRRLRRPQFIKFMALREPSDVVMEACRAAHHWGRTFASEGHTVRLLPPNKVSKFRSGNKTDQTDVAALVDAMRSPNVQAVAVKTVAQQNVQHIHRVREQWQKSRVAQINALRGVLGEYGLEFPKGAAPFLKDVREAMSNHAQVAMLQPLLLQMLEDIDLLMQRIASAERLLKAATKGDEDIKRLQSIPGFGPLNSTSLVAAAGDPKLFKSGRSLANWTGLTLKEDSSGDKRRLGSITKKGNKRVRTLIVHGARSVLSQAKRLANKTPDKLSPLQRWALNVADRRGFNKATVALANKLVRIAWVVWSRKVEYAYAPAAA